MSYNSTVNSSLNYNQQTPQQQQQHLTTQDLPDIEGTCTGYRQSYLKKYFAYYLLTLLSLGLVYLIGRWWCKLEIKLLYVRCALAHATIVLVKDSNNDYKICVVKEIILDLLPEEFVAEAHQPTQEPASSSSSNDEAELLWPTSGREGGRRSKIPPCSLLVPLGDDEGAEATTPTPGEKSTILRYFEYHEEKFIFDRNQQVFFTLNGLAKVTCANILENFLGHDEAKRNELKRIYGSNNISIIVKNYFRLFVDEALNPFYFFQLFSVAVWCLDDYVYYATCVVFIAGLSIVLSVIETRQQMETLKAMADGKGDVVVTVQRSNGEEEELCGNELVPGDVLLIPSDGFIMPCDAVVRHGTCIVNESMLTGESIPVHKTALISSEEDYDIEVFKRNTLFCGTHVIQTRFYAGNKVSCVVVRTGYSTVKGSLIRSIMFPKQVSFSFYRDAIKFVMILFGIAGIGMSYCAYVYYKRQASWNVLTLRVLDTLTIAVPPALPAAMTVGSYYAQRRLKQKQIFCTSPDRINFAGKIKLMCFDKTGTLTEGGLDLWCVVPYNNDSDSFDEPLANPAQLSSDSNLLRGMASCHSLTHINGELVGDPLDLKMFESTEWELEEPNMYQNDTQRYDLLVPTVVKTGQIEMGIIRQFEFTPQLQRMSVVVKCLASSGMTLFCKGSPEKVLPLCVNVPSNYSCILDSFTIKGYRVLAMGWKSIVARPWHQLQRISRDDIETELYFAGFIVMQNSLKPATKSVLNKLIKGGIRCVMVTGDNMLTAVSVARECNMISSSDKAIIVESSEDGDLEFKLAAHHYEEPCIIPSTSNSTIGHVNESSYAGYGINIQIGDDDDDGDDDECGQSGDENYDDDDQDILHENKFTRKRLISVSSARAIKRNSYSKIEQLDDDITYDTFIDMNNHLVTIPSTAGIIASPNTSMLRQISRLISAVEHQGQFTNYHFVMTGKVWTLLYQNVAKPTLNKILVKATVFARMNPENKRQLVEAFQDLEYCVGMCGDGANDCSALKMAHVGISLSEAEASVAAPFTSKVCDISCVPTLILEGRCALVTSFGMFKYMALYSMVQLCSVLILYTNKTNLSDAQFLFIDLGIITTLAISMGRTHPYTKIVNKRPMANLLSIQNFISLLLQILVASSLQVFAILYLQSQPWYEPLHLKDGDENVRLCWDSTTLFSVSCFQYIVLSLVFSKGYPFRKPFYTNWLLVGFYLVISFAILILMTYPVGFVAEFFELMPITFDEKYMFRLKLLAIPVVNLVASLLFEYLITNTGCLKTFFRKIGYVKSKRMYEDVLDTVEKDQSWPNVKLTG